MGFVTGTLSPKTMKENRLISKKKKKKKKKEEEKEIKKQSCSIFGLCKATSTARSQAFIGHFFYCFYLVIPDYIIVYWRVEGREVGILFGPIW